ncbi:MAG: PAS domain S-box-containing protein, partial [bacterium]
MSLKIKIVLILFTIIIFQLLIEVGVQQYIILPSYISLEKEEVIKNMDRSVEAIKREIYHLNNLTQDWARWDDTYKYVIDSNKDYMDSNLINETYLGNNLNFIGIYNLEGKTVWNKFISLKTKKIEEIYEFSQSQLPKKHYLLVHKGLKSVVAGIILTSKGAMMIATRPIIKSNHTGPIRGTIMMGRILTKKILKQLSKQTKVNLKMWSIYEKNIPKNVLIALQKLTLKNRFYIHEINDNKLVVYASLYDIQKNPLLIIQATFQRKIRAKGVITTHYAIISICFAGGLILLLIGVLIHRAFTRPISNLMLHISLIRKSQDLSKRVAIHRNDEIGWLSKEFDQMITQLQESRVELENRVAERTAAIVAANQHLEREIIERKKIESSLRESRERYRTIIDSIEEGYYEVDLEGNLTFYNDSMCTILGSSKEEMAQMNIQDFVLMQEELRESTFKDLIKAYISKEKVSNIDWKIHKKGNEICYVENSISPIFGFDQKIIGYRGISRDITARKLAEDLKEEKILAESENRTKGQFLANMSHEIRTPLNGIVGMAELLETTQPNEQQRRFINTLVNESNALLVLINDILDFSKLEVGKVELEKINFDLRVMLDDLADSMALRSEKKGIEFLTSIDLGVESKLIGDPGRLRQILVNLVNNALKFTHEGEIYTKVEVIQNYQDKIKIRFLIKDTGIGIAEENLDSIFDTFTQADSSTTREYGGTGLGTTICKQLTTLMGGEIGVESKVNVGSTFWFELPFQKQKEGLILQSFQDVTLNEVSVLLVDDNETSCSILKGALKPWGCIVTSCFSGEEALHLLSTELEDKKFQLIITDYQMPKMNGFEFAKQVRKNQRFDQIPIIALTSVGAIGDAKKCQDIGIEGYLSKPIKYQELQSVMKAILGRNQNSLVNNVITKYTVADSAQKSVRILIVDDYPTNQMVAKKHLENYGYQVDVGNNGKEGVTAFEKDYYHLILMDVQMPVMDGYEATQKIREIEKSKPTFLGNDKSSFSRIPIIAMTAHAIVGYRQKCIDAGMND